MAHKDESKEARFV